MNQNHLRRDPAKVPPIRNKPSTSPRLKTNQLVMAGAHGSEFGLTSYDKRRGFRKGPDEGIQKQPSDLETDYEESAAKCGNS